MLPQNNNFLMDKLTDFIHVYENCLSEKICNQLIEYFEEQKNKQEYIDHNGTPTFTQLNLTQNRKDKESIHDILIKKVFEYRNNYYELLGKHLFPSSHAFEEFRIKRYIPNGIERFDYHVDVIDYLTARRFLSFFWYLNDVDEGGETVFGDLCIKPKRGKLIIFPPLWLFPHYGNPPISGSKYILSTYLHYQ